MIHVGLLGCGNIGRIIAKGQDNFKITAVYDTAQAKADAFGEEFSAAAHSNFTEFLAEPCDVIVEAASVAAVCAHAKAVLEAGKDIVIMSVGALADEDFRNDLIDTARKNSVKIHIPSGAVLGLDNIKVGQIARVDKILLKTTKSPASLNRDISEKTQLFGGKAHDCVREYPKNTNVAQSLSLAAGKSIDVELWADPAEDRNMHEIFFEGEFGEIYARIRNVPSPDNPATSYLAALSILSLLRNLDSPLVIGA